MCSLYLCFTHFISLLFNCLSCFQRVIFSDAVSDKLKNIFQIWKHRIVVLSIVFTIAEFHGFPLHPQGLAMFAVKTLRFRFIFITKLNKELWYSTIGFTKKYETYSSQAN